MELKNLCIGGIVILLILCIIGSFGSISNNSINEKEPIHIINTTFTTGHTLEAKTVCTVNVGSNHSGENVTLKVVYSRDGTDLNKGDESKETVDSNGDIVCESQDSYKLYPDRAIVTLYDEKGNRLDSVNVSLNTDDSTQVAIGNGTVIAKSITQAQHSVSGDSNPQSSSSSSKSSSNNESISSSSFTTDSADSCSYVASVERNKFHYPSCKWVQKISNNNRITFNSRQDAISQGYEPCKVCQP